MLERAVVAVLREKALERPGVCAGDEARERRLVVRNGAWQAGMVRGRSGMTLEQAGIELEQTGMTQGQTVKTPPRTVGEMPEKTGLEGRATAAIVTACKL